MKFLILTLAVIAAPQTNLVAAQREVNRLRASIQDTQSSYARNVNNYVAYKSQLERLQAAAKADITKSGEYSKALAKAGQDFQTGEKKYQNTLNTQRTALTNAIQARDQLQAGQPAVRTLNDVKNDYRTSVQKGTNTVAALKQQQASSVGRLQSQINSLKQGPQTAQTAARTQVLTAQRDVLSKSYSTAISSAQRQLASDKKAFNNPANVIVN